MAKPVKFTLVVAVLSLCWGGVAPAGDVAIEYQRMADDGSTGEFYVATGTSFVECTTAAPEGPWRIPALKSEKPLYGKVTLGGKDRLLVLDRSETQDKFFNRVFFDGNGNGDLIDDPIVKSEAEEGGVVINDGAFFRSQPVDIKIAVDGGEVPYSFRIVTYPTMFVTTTADGKEEVQIGEPENVTCYLQGNCFYRGKLTLGETTYTLLLSDWNVNGRFDERATYTVKTAQGETRYARPVGDTIAMVAGTQADYSDFTALGDVLSIEGEPYRMRLDILGKRLSLDPLAQGSVKEGLGTVELFTYTERLCLESKDGEHFVVAYFPGNRFTVPAGSYRLASYIVKKRDTEGDLWMLAADGNAEVKSIDVAAGATAQLDFGEPYSPEVTVAEWARKQFVQKATRSLTLSFQIRGSAGETVSNLTRVSGTKSRIPLDKSQRRPQEPTYKIMKATGEMVASGSFEYG
ncbi:MAG: hypothetical protein AB1486_06885 [Planctomycetota bacterium]